MIIPMACMNCGNRFSNQWRAYQRRLKMRRGGDSAVSTGSTTILYVDGSNIPETPEKKTLDELGFRRDCCRKHFLTNIDLIDKV
jgi:DNA-directed RNA polymerase subunit N (RpoN/RPB10)